jgi:serine protease inhibitor
MSIRKLISKFLTQLCEKNYSQANSTLNTIVEEKTKCKVKKIIEDKKKKSSKKPTTKKVVKKGNK